MNPQKGKSSKPRHGEGKQGQGQNLLIAGVQGQEKTILRELIAMPWQ